MDVDASGHSDNSICSDDTEYLLGQNVSIREIDDDDDIQTHESARAPSAISRSYHSSPQHSPQKLQQINSANLRCELFSGVRSQGTVLIPRGTLWSAFKTSTLETKMLVSSGNRVASELYIYL